MSRKRTRIVLALFCSLLTVAAGAEASGAGKQGPWADADHVVYTPVHGVTFGGLQEKACGLTSHGGVMTSPARLVYIFWGPAFCAGGSDNAYAVTLQAYRNQLGGTPQWANLGEYGVPATNLALGTADLFDCSTPPTNVTDSAVRSKVSSYTSSHGGSDPNSIYEVVIPSTSYSSSGTITSCGGPSVAYCTYHSWIGSGVTATKYTIQPYPSCTGCKVTGWTNAQNQEHFVLHSTGNTVTNPTGQGIVDASGNEVEDKCAWSPSPYLSGGFGYQYTWSARACACVR